MKNIYYIGRTISELFPIFLFVIFTFEYFYRFIILQFDPSLLILIIYLILFGIFIYVLWCYIYENVFNGLSWHFAVDKKYKLSLFIMLCFFWMNIEYSVKFIKLLMILIKNKDLSALQKYFNDENEIIQLYSLKLCILHYDINPVIDWFEENYIRKNIPVKDPDLYALYKYLSTPIMPK